VINWCMIIRYSVGFDRALYGTIEADKVWYDTLSSYLMELGFKIYVHDHCIFNMQFNDSQLYISIHVDDLMIACKNQEVVDNVVTCLNNEYSKANVYDGHSIDYLGMIFNFIVPDEVSISMGNMINEFLTDVGVGDDARVESPAANYLYIIDDKGELLNISDKEH